jgi:hypothetical protein
MLTIHDMSMVLESDHSFPYFITWLCGMLSFPQFMGELGMGKSPIKGKWPF